MSLNSRAICIWIYSILLSFSLVSAQNSRRSEHWHQRYNQFKKEANNTMHNGYVFLGNSITEGFDLKSYFPNRPVINRGISGDHIDGLIERLDNSAIKLKPLKLFLMIGINDIGDGHTDNYLKDVYRELFDSLKINLPATEIYIQSILPTTAQWNNCPPRQIKRINQWLKEISEKKGFIFVDLYPHFISENSHYINASLSRDGLHLNESGYKKWAEILFPLIRSAQ